MGGNLASVWRGRRKGPGPRAGWGRSVSSGLMNGDGRGCVWAGEWRWGREHSCGALGPVAMETPPIDNPFQQPLLRAYPGRAS